MQPVSVMRAELWPVVRALVNAEVDEIRSVMRDYNVTRSQFTDLDDHPGYWGYNVDGGQWHWKLRWWRNRHPDFRDWWKEAS